MIDNFVPQPTELWAVRKLDYPRNEAMPRPWRPQVERVIGWSTTDGTVRPVVWDRLVGAVVFTPVCAPADEDWAGRLMLDVADGPTEVHIALHSTEADANADATAWLEDAQAAYTEAQFQATTAGMSVQGDL